jgi:hypothetical protein
MDRIKKRYPLSPEQKKIIKRYEKVTPGELAHIDLTKVPKDICMVFKIKDLYVAALEDDCTRLTYLEILKDKKASWSSPDKTDTQLSNHGHFFIFLRTIIPEKRM